jgi:hypothetical protein
MKLDITSFNWVVIISNNKEIWYKNLNIGNRENVTVFKRNQLFIFAR